MSVPIFLKHMEKLNIFAGIDISYQEQQTRQTVHHLLIAVTELKSKTELDQTAAVFSAVISQLQEDLS